MQAADAAKPRKAICGLEALAPKTLAQKALHGLQRPVKSLKGSANIGEMGLVF